MNIKRVEVIYGPASTMYGPNAFSGVINVITKDPGQYLKNNQSFGFNASAGAGTFNTKYIEATVAYKKAAFSFSLTGRMYYSDRPDLLHKNYGIMILKFLVMTQFTSITPQFLKGGPATSIWPPMVWILLASFTFIPEVITR
jgi:outer membrane receptor protein involved in Fe transport